MGLLKSWKEAGKTLEVLDTAKTVENRRRLAAEQQYAADMHAIAVGNPNSAEVVAARKRVVARLRDEAAAVATAKDAAALLNKAHQVVVGNGSNRAARMIAKDVVLEAVDAVPDGEERRELAQRASMLSQLTSERARAQTNYQRRAEAYTRGRGRGRAEAVAEVEEAKVEPKSLSERIQDARETHSEVTSLYQQLPGAKPETRSVRPIVVGAGRGASKLKAGQNGHSRV